MVQVYERPLDLIKVTCHCGCEAVFWTAPQPGPYFLSPRCLQRYLEAMQPRLPLEATDG